ncbi:hypothetical protein HMI56_005294 [Coelomomyces lativittatus]|nr:hypothetical protein HMI56_005294 [Coelomomyces lativittatus]
MKIEVVRHAKVPIVKAVHYALGISVDISVNQVIGMTTVDTVKVWSERHPALRPLTLVLKMFFFCRELNEVFTGGISSYTLITMVYVFLDMHPLLRSHEINEQENLGVLLIEWFELFGRCFDPKLTMVTVHGFRNKSTEFIQKLRLNPNFLSILDPLNKDNDLSRGAKCTQEIRSAIEWGYDVLTQAILFSQSQSQFLFPTFLGLIFYMDEALLRKRKALMFYAEEIENQLKKFIHSGASSSSFKNKRRNDPH